MHRNRTWQLDPAELRTQRNRILPIEGGDGSTLTLDFTTGVLDPLLSFSRQSNATFVDSDGFLVLAPANMVPNSVWDDATALPARWGYGGAAGSSDVSIPAQNIRRVTNTNTANQYFITSLGSDSLGAGLTYYAQVEITEVNGTVRANQAMYAFHNSGGTSNPAIVTYIINGAPAAGTASVVVGRLGVVFTVNAAGSHLLRIGTSISSGGTTATGAYIGFTKPHLVQGTHDSRTSRYYPNSNTTSNAGYYAPRFDYDPISRAPRGLLIEGQSVNVASVGASSNSNTSFTCYNVGFGPTYWEPLTLVQGIDGSPTSAAGFTLSANGFLDGRFGLVSTGVTTFSVTSGQTYTASFYYKATRGGNPLAFSTRLINGGTVETPTTSVDLPGPNGFTRRVVTFTANASVYGIAWVYGANFQIGDSFHVTGMQVELGSGASSYIPTGASTGTRNADKMSLLDITPMQWNQTAGTFALSMDVTAETNTATFAPVWGMYTAAPVRVVRNLLNNSSGTNPRLNVDIWTSAPAQILGQSITRPTSPTLTKFAFALSNSGQAVAMCVNSGAITTASGTGTMQTPTRLLFHQDPSSGDTEYFPIHIRSFKYWPTALPNAQLQSITT